MQKKITLLASLLLLVCGSLFAQLSDEQIISEAKKLQETGMSQSQIFQELARKGVTAVQFQRIRGRLNSQTSSSASSAQNYSEGSRTDAFDSGAFINQREPDPQDNLPPRERVFGHDFFTRSNLTFAPSTNMPTPANYVLGAGDEIIIDVIIVIRP